MTHTTQKQKPKRLRKWIIIALAAFIILWIIGTAIGTDETTTEAEPEPTQTEQVETQEPEPEPDPSEAEAKDPEPEPEPSETKEQEPEERRETDTGLDPVNAQVACVQEAEALAYPEELKVHTVMGKKQEIINEDEIRFLWDATLKSAAGGELRGEVLCIATGSNDSPDVEIEFR